MENPVITTTNKGLLENVKVINKKVKEAEKYLQEHFKEVYQIHFKPMTFEDGHIKIEIYFNANDSGLKEAQKKIDAEQNMEAVKN